MENLWLKAHNEIINMKVGDFYLSGGSKISVIKRTNKRVYFSNGDIVTISKSKYGFYYLKGKRIFQILRDLEGYFIFLKHSFFLTEKKFFQNEIYDG